MSHIQSPTLVPGGKDRQRQEQVEEFKMNNNANPSYEELKAANALKNMVAQARSQQRGGSTNQGGGVNVRRGGNNQGGSVRPARRQYVDEAVTSRFQREVGSEAPARRNQISLTSNQTPNIPHDLTELRDNRDDQSFSMFSFNQGERTFSTPQNLQDRHQDSTVLMDNVARRTGGGVMSVEPTGFVEVDSQTITQPTNPTLPHTESSNAHVNLASTSQDVSGLVRRIQELELQNQDLSRRYRQDQAADNDQQVSEEEEAEAQFQEQLERDINDRHNGNNRTSTNVYTMSEVNPREKGTPWKSLDLALRGKVMNKVVLTSDANSFQPWKRYIKNVLDNAWMSCLSKINIYQVPDSSTWETWDYNCLNGVTGNLHRITYLDVMEKTDSSEPVMSYKNQQGRMTTFSPGTHVDIMNTALLALHAKYGSQLFHSVCSILVNSIDEKTMKSVLNFNQVFDITNLRKTYIDALMFHEYNSDSMVSLRVSKFNSMDCFKMEQNEPPKGYLRRLQDEAQFINSMTPTGEVPPISERTLRSKFLIMAKQIDYLQPAIRSYEIGYVDQHGVTRPHSLEKYAQLLQTVHQDRKDKYSSSSRDHYHSNQRGFSMEEVEQEEFGMAAHGDAKDSKPNVCYAFRDTGKCKFGDTCKFEHVRGKFPPKANLSREAMAQYVENLEHAHALQIQEYKKKYAGKFRKSTHKMDQYKKKLGERNFRNKGSKERAAVAEESKEEKAAAVKEEEEDDLSESDIISDLSGLEEDEELDQ